MTPLPSWLSIIQAALAVLWPDLILSEMEALPLWGLGTAFENLTVKCWSASRGGVDNGLPVAHTSSTGTCSGYGQISSMVEAPPL